MTKKELRIEKSLKGLSRLVYSSLNTIPKNYNKARAILFDCILKMVFNIRYMRSNKENFYTYGLETDAWLTVFDFHLRILLDLCGSYINKQHQDDLVRLTGELGAQLGGWLKSGLKDDQKL